MTQYRLSGFLIPLLVCFSIGSAQPTDLRQIVDLSGIWKFELGDNVRWSDPAFDDSRWDKVEVPSPWEEQGYPGYDGYGWYRKHFRLDSRDAVDHLYLSLAHIDDAGEIYLNGHMIGFVGKFPPDFNTGANISFQCPVPQDYLLYGSDNVLAVRVYDHYQAGGIVRGDVGLYESRDFISPEFDLSGTWKFKTGDDEEWAKISYDDSKWQEIKVPLFWEAQGYRDYDGYAWYRMKFKVPAGLAGERLMILLGRIDDVDETYLNGELIGRTGNMRRSIGRVNQSSEWQQLRAYALPSSLLVTDRENVLAVRVLDVWQHGGIYDGPVGLIKKSRYLSLKDRRSSIWERLRDLFFR